MSKNILNKGFLIVFGGIICIYIFYQRVLKTRLPRDLYIDLYENGHYVIIVLYAVIFLSFFVLFLQSIKEFLTFNNKNILTESLKLHKISAIWFNSLRAFNQFILENTLLDKYIGTILETTGLFLYKKFVPKRNQWLVYIIMVLVPKSIVLCCLLLDVFLLRKFYYVYKISFILLLPLLEKYIHFLLKEFCDINFKQIDACLEFSHNSSKKKLSAIDVLFGALFPQEFYNFSYKTLNICLTERYLQECFTAKANIKKIIQYHSNLFFNVFLPIRSFEILYALNKSYFSKYFHLVLYASYLIVWGYVFIYSW